MPLFAIQQVTDKARLRAFLQQDKHYAAYALADLEPPHAKHATWFAASRDGAIAGLALLYQALEPPVLFLMGDEPALSALLLHGIGPERVTILAPTPFENVLQTMVQFEEMQHMLRMRITSGTFVEPKTDIDATPEPLTKSHTADIRNLLAAAAQADQRHMDDIAFSPEMLADGTYYGIFTETENDDERHLIAAGGTHLASEAAGIAAVGNIVTHPEHRRKGYGRHVTTAITKKLLDTFDMVVLNVNQRNGPAVALYKSLGYQQVATFLEGIGRL